jgi:hypothetical protein
MVNLIEILERRNGIIVKPRGGMVDYSRFSYCAKCNTKKDKELTFCDYCGRRLRHRPLTKHGRYWDGVLKYIE